MTRKPPRLPLDTSRAVHSRLPSLTGMRFVAALLVFLFHSSQVTPPLSPFRGDLATWFEAAFSQAGWVGVSFFFVLSGFVLTWAARPTDTPRRFWRRRAVKMYPNHIVMFAVMMALVLAATPRWQQWLPNLLLVQTWIPRTDTIFSINPPSWSLSCEILFYLCFPLLYRRLTKIDPARLWIWAGAVVAAVVAVAVTAQFALPGEHMTAGPGEFPFPASIWQVWFVYALPPVRMLEFVLGMLMARIVLTGRWINLPLLPAGLLTAAAYLASSAVPWAYATVAVCLVPIALLIPAAAAADVSADTSPFRSRTMVRLGELSFALYLVHGPVIIYGRTKLGFGVTFGPWAAAALILACLAISLTLAWLLHTAVETPMMNRWSRPTNAARKPDTVPAVATAHPGPPPATTAASPAPQGPQHPGAPAREPR